jgi:hypothetical protein
MKRSRYLYALFLGLGLSAASVGVVVASVATADPPREGYAPDPPVVPSTKHWVFTIHAKEGVVSLGSAKSAKTEKPEGTPRVLGRFAIELWCGKELLDRVRFNVPGMGDGPRRVDKRILKRPAMDLITTHFNVRIADNPRTTNAKFIDRATGEETPIPWPPDAVAADAGTPDASTTSTPADAGPPPKGSAGPPKGSAGPRPEASAGPPKDASTD